MTNFITIQLTQGYATFVSEEDSDLATQKWFAAVKPNGQTYAHRGAYKTIRLHRVILARMLGRELLENEQCDHKNGNGLDNRRSNLRLATGYENSLNRKLRKNNQLGLKGVSRKGKRFVARITVNKKTIQLGIFDSPQEAHDAYRIASKCYHGQFGRTE